MSLDGFVAVPTRAKLRGRGPLYERRNLNAVLEVKCPYRYKKEKKHLQRGGVCVQVYERMWELVGDGRGCQVPIPPKYQLQVQWAMGTVGVEAVYFCAYVPCNPQWGAPPQWKQRLGAGRACKVLGEGLVQLGEGCWLADVMTKEGLVQVTRVPFMADVYGQLYATADHFWHHLYAPTAAMWEADIVHLDNVDAAVAALMDEVHIPRTTAQPTVEDQEGGVEDTAGAGAGVVGSWDAAGTMAAVVEWGGGWEEV